MTQRPTPINEERQFEPHELFFSITDLKGVIKYGNDVFTRISAYDAEELIGKPHNIVRHPDMPRAVFKLLWDYLESGRTIAAYVKNLAKDGRYYWVLATVMPVPGGYLSIRLKPTSPLFDAVRSVYAEALAAEKNAEEQGGDRNAAMQAGAELILRRLAEHGFKSYDDFMSSATAQELCCRENRMQKDRAGESRNAQARDGRQCDLPLKLTEILSSTSASRGLAEELEKKKEDIRELGPSLRFLALNALMAASRLGDQGVVQAAVAAALGAKSKEAERSIESLMKGMPQLHRARDSQVFNLSLARIEAEMARIFEEELQAAPPSSCSQLVLESLTSIMRELEVRCDSISESTNAFDLQTQLARTDVQTLITCIAEMKAIQFNGKIEAAACSAKSNFAVIFTEASRFIESGRSDCGVLLEVFDKSVELVESVRAFEPQLVADLRAMKQTIEARLDAQGAAAAC